MAMTFDPKTKEVARAHDAVDRLRNIHKRIERQREKRSWLADFLIRGALLALSGYAIIYAFIRL